MATFDNHAQSYDSDFTDSPIAQYLRNRIHMRLLSHFQADAHILELGCGTGEDALFLAENGIRVTATDVSENMLQITRTKTNNHPLITTAQLDLSTLPTPQQMTRYDGVFSNFGPLNCIDNWKPLAQWLSERVKPNGIIGFGIMSPYCLWEIGWHGLHLNIKTTFRRFRKNTTFDDIKISYPTIKRITQDFLPHFERTHVEGLGLFLPPSDVYGVIEKRPKLLKSLTRLEDRFSPYSKLAMFADHYWIEFRRK